MRLIWVDDYLPPPKNLRKLSVEVIPLLYSDRFFWMIRLGNSGGDRHANLLIPTEDLLRSKNSLVGLLFGKSGILTKELSRFTQSINKS